MSFQQRLLPWMPSFAVMRFCLLALSAVGALSCGASLMAEDEEEKPAAKKEKKIPAPEDLVLETNDGLQLTITYYASLKGKNAIPVVLLHEYKQSRNDYKDLAPSLQALGYAVIVPDLRGHGESTHLKGARKDETLNAASLSPQQFSLMVTQDMEAVKEFLWERNNEGELNIDKLCIVGAEMGASVALNFALADAVVQDRNRVARPDYKVGRFVKALVLISPEQSFRGLPIKAATAYPAIQRDIAMLILVGRQDAKAMKEAKQIHSIFEKYHPEPTGDNVTDKKTLFFGKMDTKLQGTKLLDPKFNVPAIIADFLHRRLSKSEESRDWTWRERKVPHE